MRLLPRTPRGTTRLALAAWLAGAVLLWGTLPVRPRLVLAARGVPLPLSRMTPVGFQPDGRTFVTADNYRGDFFFLNAGDSSVQSVRSVDGPITGYPALAADGRTLAFARDDSAHVWDVPAWRERAVLPGTADPVVFSPDGRYLVGSSVGDSFAVRVWDLSADPPRVRDLPAGFHGGCGFAFAPDGRYLAAVLDAGWIPSPGKRVGPEGLAFSGGLIWWDVDGWREAGRAALTPDNSSDTMEDAAFTADGLLAVRRGGSSRVDWLDPENGRVRLSLPTPDLAVVVGQSLSSSGRVLAVTRYRPAAWGDALVRLTSSKVPVPDFVRRWVEAPSVQLLDAATGAEVGRLPGKVAHARWSPDGRTLALVGADSAIELWDVPPRRPWGGAALLAGLWALAVAALAQWRLRRLRRAAVST
jgi:WD40 repeat protein